MDSFEGKFILSTWHSNKYRENAYLKTIWKKFNIVTKEHFYHLGGSQNNRNSMLEALILNHKPTKIEENNRLKKQLSFEELLYMQTPNKSLELT